jgi:acyl dehydratase
VSASTAAFDRLTVGDVHHYGAHTFTAEEIKRFAGAYDPQAFHLDEAEAARSQFGKLAASGWHTTAVMMKLRVAYLAREAEKAAARGEPVLRFGPSPGFDNLKWIRPVHAGDTLTFTDEVTAKRKSQSRPGWGIVTMATKAVNQRGETAFSMTGHVFAATGEE